MNVLRAAVLGVILLSLAALGTGIDDPYEANVIGVDYEQYGQEYAFWVTISDEDDGSNQSYPVWWTVETGEGDVIANHSIQQPVNGIRVESEGTYTVPDDVRYLTVRGYDNVYGYGGESVEIDLEGEQFRQQTRTDDDGSLQETGGENETGILSFLDGSGGGGSGPAPGDDTGEDGGLPLLSNDAIGQQNGTTNTSTDDVIAYVGGWSEENVIPALLIGLVILLLTGMAIRQLWRQH